MTIPKLEPRETRFITCEACQGAGRDLRNHGGPDDIDYDICPICDGEAVIEIEVEPRGHSRNGK